MNDVEIPVSGEPYMKKSKLLSLAKQYLFKPLQNIFSKGDKTTVYGDVIIRNAAGQILLLQKQYEDEGMEGRWGFPGGHIEIGEEAKAGAIREAQEETGLVLVNAKHIDTKILPGCIIHYYEAQLADAISSTSTTNPVSQFNIILDAREHRGYEWVEADKVTSYHLIKNLGSYVWDLIQKLTSYPVNRQPQIAIETASNELNLEVIWEILQKAFDEGKITEEQFMDAHEKYTVAKAEESLQTLSKAFDNDLITEEQYLGAVEKAKAIHPIGMIKKFGGRDYIKAADGSWKYHGKGTGQKAQAHAAGAREHQTIKEKSVKVREEKKAKVASTKVEVKRPTGEEWDKAKVLGEGTEGEVRDFGSYAVKKYAGKGSVPHYRHRVKDLIDHPDENHIRFYDYWEQDGHAYVAMQKVTKEQMTAVVKDEDSAFKAARNAAAKEMGEGAKWEWMEKFADAGYDPNAKVPKMFEQVVKDHPIMQFIWDMMKKQVMDLIPENMAKIDGKYKLFDSW